MRFMFANSEFNGNLTKWDVSNVGNMRGMFQYSKFRDNISQWDVSSVTDMRWMFRVSEIKKETVHSWDNFKNHNINEMFE
jgi:surface protein